MNIKELTDTYNTLSEEIAKDVDMNLSKIGPYTALLIFTPLLLTILEGITKVFNPVLTYYNFGTGEFPLGTFGLFIFMLLLIYITGLLTIGILKFLRQVTIVPILRKFQYTIHAINEINNWIASEVNAIDNLDIILDKSLELQYLQKKLFQIRFFVFIFNPKNGYPFSQMVHENLIWCIEFLKDINSDLQVRITEKKEDITQAKSNLSTHVHGTDELNQVSELQQARLDKQIAQFEELQRVLVKV